MLLNSCRGGRGLSGGGKSLSSSNSGEREPELFGTKERLLRTSSGSALAWRVALESAGHDGELL